MKHPSPDNDNHDPRKDHEPSPLPSLKEAAVAAGLFALVAATLLYEFAPTLPVLQKTAKQCACEYNP